jgi:hypothetical protein
LRFLREELRPFELPRLLSLGAWVSESLSTRLDSVRAPDLLCVDEDLLDPDDRLRDLAPERPLEEDERFVDLDEEPFELPLELLREEPLELPELLLLRDLDFCWGIRPSHLLDDANRCSALTRIRMFKHATRVSPNSSCSRSNLCRAGKAKCTAGANGAAGTEAKRGDNNGSDNAILEHALQARWF